MCVSTLCSSWRWNYLIFSTIWEKKDINGMIEQANFQQMHDLTEDMYDQ